MNILKRVLALAMCLFMMAPAVSAFAETDVYGRIADPVTNDGWEAYFGDDIKHTAYAGAVWTDKSVYLPGTGGTLGQIPASNLDDNVPLIADTGDNFLVSLSAMSSNKSIVGHETIPTDTIFVLDVSSSMYRKYDAEGNAYHDKTTVSDMMTAVNAAIKSLYELNAANRVGVVLYLGDGVVTIQSTADHGILMLPLGRYEVKDAADPYAGFIQVTTNNKGHLTGAKINDDLVYKFGGQGSPATTNWPSSGSIGIAGTFAQRGIQIASDMFESATTVVSEEEDSYQAGKDRLPIMVLMTDGLPTAATSSFANVTDAQWGSNTNGERSPAESDFVTQLTAAYAKEVMAARYDGKDRKPLLYTLGLGQAGTLAEDILDPKKQDELYQTGSREGYTVMTGRAHSNYVVGSQDDNMRPEYQNTAAQVNRRIAYYWDKLVNAGEVGFNAYVAVGTNKNDWKKDECKEYQEVEKTGSKTVTGGTDGKSNTIPSFPDSVEKKYYVDQAFRAPESANLEAAFTSIVEEIVRQSAYYPTQIETTPQMDGYLTFVDDIGKHMEVRDVKGIISAEVYYDGELFAQTVSDNVKQGAAPSAGSAAVYQQILSAISERLGSVSEDGADRLLNAAYAKGDIAYTTNSHSNKVVWYAKYNGNTYSVEYMPYGEMTGSTEGDPNSQARVTANYAHYAPGTGRFPPDAEYRVTSYTFGGYHPTYTQEALDSVYGFVRVVEKIEGGEIVSSTVDWRVPAVLIPLVSYNVVLDEGVSIADNASVSIMRDSATPVSLLFEVGLKEGINADTVSGIVSKAPPEGSTEPANYDASTGEYIFYTNDWHWEDDWTAEPEDHLGHLDYYHTNPSETRNAVSWFEPNSANENYFYTTDTPLYVMNGEDYVVYSGEDNPATAKASGMDFYSRRVVYSIGDSAAWNDDEHDEPIEGTTGSYYLRCQYGLDDEDNFERKGNNWYYKAGVAHPMLLDGDDPLKEQNTTDTLPYSRFTSVRVPNQNSNLPYFSIGTLGNNGLIRLRHAPVSIELSASKRVTDAQTGQDVEGAVLSGYEFQLSDGTNTLQTKFSDTDGSVTFDPISFSYRGQEEETFAYTIKEVKKSDPSQAGHVIYDETEYTATVLVKLDETDPDNPKMTASVSYSNTAAGSVPVFNNKIVPSDIPAKAVLRAEKTYQDATPTDTQKFTFRLLDANGTLLQEKNNAGRYVTFDEIVYTQAGPYVYKIVEVPGDKPSQAGDVVYDSTVYEAIVEVSKSVNETTYQTTYMASAPKYRVYGSNETPSESVPVFNNDEVDDAEPVYVSLEATKLLDNKAPGAEAYEFKLTSSEAGTPMPEKTTATNNAAGEVTFGPIKFNAEGTYVYEITEVAGRREDRIYDQSKYIATVTVDESFSFIEFKMKLKADVTYEKVGDSSWNGNEPVFNNWTITEKPISISLDAQKNLTGETLTAGAYSFLLTSKTTGAPMPEKTTATNNAAGEVAFGPITFDAVGKYEYEIVEIAGNREDMIYDQSKYAVTVDVSRTLVGTVYEYSAQVTYKKVGDDSWTGAQPVFSNKTMLKPQAVIEAKKTLDGNTPAAEAFKFHLVEYNTETGETGARKWEKENDADGVVKFDPIEYEAKEGVYTYLLYEEKGAAPNKPGDIIHDPTQYLVTVTVRRTEGTAANNFRDLHTASVQYQKMNTDGTLGEADTTKPTFSNLIVKGSETSIELSAKKTLSGGTLAANQFTFRLEAKAGAPMPAVDTEVKNDANGDAKFGAIEYTQPDTYVYTISEVIPANVGNIVYDTSVWQATVTVNSTIGTIDGIPTELLAATASYQKLDNGNPTGAASANAPEFVNRIIDVPVINVKLGAVKTLDEKQPGSEEFRFSLYQVNADNTETLVETVKSNADGSVDFAALQYAEGENWNHDQISTQTFTYRIREVAGENPIIIYDPTLYEVKVVITGQTNMETLERELTSEVTYLKDGKVIESERPVFSNKTMLEPHAVIEAKKTLDGNTPAAEAFKFHLVEYNTETGETGARKWEKENDADGIVRFDPIEYEAKEGVYTYLLYEEKGAEPTKPEDVIHDPTQYLVTVTVRRTEGTAANNFRDLHTASVQYQKMNEDGTLGEAGAARPTFNNMTVGSGETTAVLMAGKTLDGKAPAEAGKFSFELRDSAGVVIDTKKDEANGVVTFKAIKYTAPGTYVYTISEVIPENTGEIVYDKSVWQATVKVESRIGTDESGKPVQILTPLKPVYQKLDASGTPTGAESETPPVFVNMTIVPGEVQIPLLANKLFDGQLPSANRVGKFTFALLDGQTGTQLETAVNGVGGKVTFTPIEITEPGTYTYIIHEVIPANAGDIIYDKSYYRASVTVTGRLEGYHEILTASPVTYTLIASNGQDLGLPAEGAPTFKNFGPPSIPETGDKSQMAFFALLLAGCVAGLMIIRRRKSN